MNPTKTVAIATALAGVLLSAHAGSVEAADIGLLKMKPMQGVSFDVGAERAVSYFLADNGRCKLVVTRAEEPNWDEGGTFRTTRFEAAIVAGKATQYAPGTGQVFEFACLEEARAMTLKSVDVIAAGAAAQ